MFHASSLFIYFFGKSRQVEWNKAAEQVWSEFDSYAVEEIKFPLFYLNWLLPVLTSNSSVIFFIYICMFLKNTNKQDVNSLKIKS